MSGRRSTRKSATSPEESGLVVLSGYGFWYALGEVSFMALLKDSERLITGEELLHLPDLGPCELIDARSVPLPPATVEHGEIEVILGSELRAWGVPRVVVVPSVVVSGRAGAEALLGGRLRQPDNGQIHSRARELLESAGGRKDMDSGAAVTGFSPYEIG
jgi:hypothetical protein